MSLSIEEKLPTELLEHIISLAPRTSLLNLCLTSKTLNRLAKPFLYSEIYLKETVHLPALAYLIITSPAHAALVKSIIVPRTWAATEEKFCIWSWPRSEDPDLYGVLKAKCAECTGSDEDADELYGEIQSGENEDAIMVLLLTSLPNLRRLNINCDLYGHNDFVSLWRKTIRGIASRRNLSAEDTLSLPNDSRQVEHSPAMSTPIDVMVVGADDKMSNSTDHLAAFFHLPNLRSIYGWKHGDDEAHDDLSEFALLQPRSCPVEYVELRCAKLDVENFQHMLDATIPGKLKTLNYESGGSWAWCRMEHPAMMQSLAPHCETLEALGLSHEDFYPYPDNESSIYDKPYPCSFTSFTALQRLKIAPLYIWGHRGLTGQEGFTAASRDMLWSALPRNLQELWITRAQNQDPRHNSGSTAFVPQCLLPALDLVVRNKHTAFPELTHLRIELPLLDWKDEWLDGLATISRAAAAEEIETTIILCDMFSRYRPITAERDWGWNEDVKWEPTCHSYNRECLKVWIEATPQRQPHLTSILKDMKTRFEEERERYKEAQAKINKLGQLCTACQLSGDYDSSQGIGLPERFVDERLGKEPYWKGRGGIPDVVT
jgi:hypothetical protein